jgi:hypothetical protein
VLGGSGGAEELITNGDFSDGLEGWTLTHGSQIPDSWNVFVEGSASWCRWYRNAGADGGHAGVRQDLEADVSGASQLVLRAKVKVVRHDLGSSGWWSDVYGGTGEYPAKIQVRYRDADGAVHVWTHGFLAGPNSQRLQNYSISPAGVWSEFEVDLCDEQNRLKPDPARRTPEASLPPIHTITRVEFLGCGWSFEGMGDDLSLQRGGAQEPLLLQGLSLVPDLADLVESANLWSARFANEALRVLTGEDFGEVPGDMEGRSSLAASWEAWWDERGE